VGNAVRDDVDEERTSVTYYAYGVIKAFNRKHRELYVCSCGCRVQADMNGTLNIFERAYQVSPMKGSSGRVARPAVVSFLLGWHDVAERSAGEKLCMHPPEDATNMWENVNIGYKGE